MKKSVSFTVTLEIETEDDTTPVGKAFLCDSLFHIIDNERHKGELDADEASVNSVKVEIDKVHD